VSGDVHVVIMGCGRVGSSLAGRLVDAGHEVAVIDMDDRAFDRLGENFPGRTVTGLGFDRDVLLEAGINEAAAFAAVSSGDNSNIIAARVARETFGVERVVARIYDQRRAQVYERLGIPTVAVVPWATEQILRRVDPPSSAIEWSDPTGQIVLASLPVPEHWVGHKLSQLAEAANVRVVVVARAGHSVLPEKAMVLQDGDVVHVAMARDRRQEVTDAFATPPEGGH
jgi:trk system potassium uptake protein TrkA